MHFSNKAKVWAPVKGLEQSNNYQITHIYNIWDNPHIILKCNIIRACATKAPLASMQLFWCSSKSGFPPRCDGTNQEIWSINLPEWEKINFETLTFVKNASLLAAKAAPAFFEKLSSAF